MFEVLESLLTARGEVFVVEEFYDCFLKIFTEVLDIHVSTSIITIIRFL